jgi:hypothetical protein
MNACNVFLSNQAAASGPSFDALGLLMMLLLNSTSNVFLGHLQQATSFSPFFFCSIFSQFGSKFLIE